METYVLAGGPFITLDAAFRTLRGVSAVVSGYTGGDTDDPTPAQVATGTTGHVEAVSVTFDPELVRGDVVLDAFFTAHDPGRLDGDGDGASDANPTHRSAMFFTDDAQRAAFEASRDRAIEWWDGQVVTTVEPLEVFFPAAAVDQDTAARHPESEVVQAAVAPRVARVRSRFADYSVSA
ncbi:peptide-methionine (S)-S-oxide reductase [Microbacterium sp. P05]|uniref:peptide-methionine (S)-S-oxide reductase n=1 Tax=Microbacterium sp. P05 TaxID=3366948 RepID=UPI00374716E0